MLDLTKFWEYSIEEQYAAEVKVLEEKYLKRGQFLDKQIEEAKAQLSKNYDELVAAILVVRKRLKINI